MIIEAPRQHFSISIFGRKYVCPLACSVKTIYEIITIVNTVANRLINATYLPASVQKNEWLVYMTRQVSFRKKLHEVEMLFCRIIRYWFTYICGKIKSYNACETSKFNGENMNCMLRHSVYVLSKLILRLSEEFEIMISAKTVYSLQNFCGLKWQIWAICWVLRWLLLHRWQGWKCHFDRQTDFHPEIWIARLSNRT